MIASFWTIVTDTVWPIVQFFIGINIVVFFHELGHFTAARWAGIRVDRFAIGMGPRLFGFVRGDTDYCVCALPIGGYVKMLGQEDFAPRKEGDDAEDTDETPAVEEAPQDETPQPMHPDSYNAKPVGKRLVVIAAGVVMNIILAAVMFVTICMIGIDFPAPVAGNVVPGLPAADAKIVWADQAPPRPAKPGVVQATNAPWVGLAVGDELLTIDGDPVTRFDDVRLAALLSDDGDEHEITFQRTVGGKTYHGTTTIKAMRLPGSPAPQFGIAMPATNIIGETTGQLIENPLQQDDEIVEINGQPVQDEQQRLALLASLPAAPVQLTFLRDGSRQTLTLLPELQLKGHIAYQLDGTRIELESLDLATQKATYHPASQGDEKAALKTVSLDDLAGGQAWTTLDVLGLSPRIVIASVSEGAVFNKTPATDAGLLPGDIVTSYADKPNPTFMNFVQTSDARSDQATNLIVERDGKALPLQITPEKNERTGRAIVGVTTRPDLEHLVVAHVRKGSFFDKANILPGAVLESANDEALTDWVDLFRRLTKLQQTAGKTLTLKFADGKTVALTAEDLNAPTGFKADDYHISLLTKVPFTIRTVEVVKRNPLDALGWGVQETGRLVLSSYGSLRSIITGSVSHKEARGIIGIGEVAVKVARKGPMRLAYLIALISVALAVFNFLPLPVLDGGHAVLLICEKVRGKPLPLKLVNIIQMVGLGLILCLLVLTFWQDIARFFQQW